MRLEMCAPLVVLPPSITTANGDSFSTGAHYEVVSVVVTGYLLAYHTLRTSHPWPTRRLLFFPRSNDADLGYYDTLWNNLNNNAPLEQTFYIWGVSYYYPAAKLTSSRSI